MQQFPFAIRRLVAALGIALLVPFAGAEDWPGWRGPRGDGTSSETGVPVKWSATEGIKWKVPLPGKGHGTPSIVGDRIFLVTCIEPENKRVLMCLDRRNGKVLWEQVVLVAPLERKHSLNSYASSTPYCDGERVFVTFLDVGSTPGEVKRPNTKTNGVVLVACYSIDGKEIWKKTVGNFSSVHGWSCSPVPYADSIIVNCDHDGDGYIVRLRRSDGGEVWRIERPNKTRSYCNPTIFDINGTKHMVLSGSKCTTSYDPDTGRNRWMLDGPTEQFAASMIFTDGLFFITGGFPTYHSLGISPDGKELWHQKGSGLAAYVPSPIAYQKWFFIVTDADPRQAKAVCFEAKTGQPVWTADLGKHHRPSAVLADGNIYWLSDEGTCFVVKASEKFELVAKNELGEACNASPIFCNGQIFIRSDVHLWCIGK